MALPRHRLLCTWHIDENWREAIKKPIHEKNVSLKILAYDERSTHHIHRSTSEGRASGFRGRVLQLTGTLHLTGVPPLDYQEDDAPLAPMEVVASTEVAGTSATSTGPDNCSSRAGSYAIGCPTAPPRRPARPPRQRRPQRMDILTDIQAQCAESLHQGTDLLRVK
ncbi:hypothetical protein HPB52_012236 [Rhipicephalus sanguineus]|uniref:Uncharacterized protein n=1 Tax=Rhipicephalus sanguineus TaxID=34632 RepID=A0A9D4PZM9_RHISA|nr:hypothetical protein HPB52_012236 [Rhipicephalus sanguineus]